MPLVITDTLPNCVVPLFLVTGKDQFEQWGSALFLRFENAFFLATAAHVVAGLRGNDNLVMQGWNGSLTETPNTWQRTMPKESPTVKADRDDVAVALLTEEMVAGLFSHNYGCLEGQAIDPLPLSTGDSVVFCGYPAVEQTCLHLKEFSFIHLRPHAFHTKIARPSEAIGVDFHDDRYIVAEYRISVDHPFPNQPDAVPLPPGMSGGAVYRYENGRPVGFVGIIHRWIDPGLLIATRAHAIIPMLDAELAANPSAFRHKGADET